MDKKTARARGLKRRSMIPAAERHQRSALLLEKLIPYLEKYDVIGCYVSMKDEAETDGIIRYCFDHGKKIAVPKVNGSTLEFCLIRSYDDLSPGCFGVMEPQKGERIDPADIELMIVPLSSFDTHGHRTGYGKGYYDSVLTPDQKKIGIAFAEQYVNEIEADPWDVALDEIVQA